MKKTNPLLMLVTILVTVGIACSALTGESMGIDNGGNTPSSIPESTILASLNTATPQATSTPNRPPSLTMDNYKQFGTLYTWKVNSDIGRVNGIAISQATKRVVLITQRAKEVYGLELHDLEGNMIWEKTLEAKAAWPAIAFSPDGMKIAVGLENGKVQLWNTEAGTFIDMMGKHRYPVRIIVFSPDGKYLASGASDNQVHLWDLVTQVQTPTCFYWDPSNRSKCQPGNKTDVRDLAFSPDGKYLAVSANVVVLLDTSTGLESDRYWDYAGDTKDLGEVAFSPDGQTIASSGDWFNTENQKYRKRILLWNYPGGSQNPIKVPLDDALEDLVFSPDGKVIIGSYKNKGLLMLFDRAARNPIGTIDLGPSLLMSYSFDLRMFAVLSTRTSVSIWGVLQ